MVFKKTFPLHPPRISSIFNKLNLFIFLLVIACGCTAKSPAKDFYSLEQIPQTVEKLCKEEFNLNVRASLSENCLWVYFPAEKLLDSSFNILESASVSLDRVSLVIGRVILNSANPPDFYVLVASDVKSIGLDYMIIIYTKDLKRYYYSRISRGDFSKRKVVNFKLNLMALNDSQGNHIVPSNINMHKFLAEQFNKRLKEMFREEPLRGFASAKSVEGDYEENSFIFKLDFSQTNKSANVDITKEAFKMISAVLKDYDFKDFSEVKIIEIPSGRNTALSQKALFEDFK